MMGLVIPVFGALFVYVFSGDDEKFLKENAVNALNWQITYILVGFSLILLSTYAGPTSLVFIPFIALLNIIFCIFAAIKAFNMETWSYPLSLNFV